MAPASFRTTGWDPLLITAQIVALQSVFYILISLLLLIALALTGDELSLDAILSDTEIRTDTVFGWTLALVWLVNAVVAIPVLVLLIQRSKLVLDFVLTLEFIHLIFVWIHTRHFPTCAAWWILQTVSAIVMTLGGEWACMRRELEPILVSKKKPTSSNNNEEQIAAEEQRQSPTSSSSFSQPDIVEAETAEGNADWVHIGKKKRKTSDPSSAVDGETSRHIQQEDHAPFTRAVGKAKKVIIQSAQRAATTTRNKGKRYETIPMTNVDATSSESK